jgi:ABC-type antimicrobial peptide transport system permease subunit
MLKPSASPRLSSVDVLEALGLERRHSRGRDVAFAVGLTLGGILIGAVAVLLRAGVVSLANKPVEQVS